MSSIAKTLYLILIIALISSCASSTVKVKKQGIYKKHDILIDSVPSNADIFIYPEGIVAKTPIYVNRLEIANATIDFKKDGYKDKSVFVKKKERFLLFHTLFGNIILLPLYPFGILYDLGGGWDIKKPGDKLVFELEKKNHD